MKIVIIQFDIENNVILKIQAKNYKKVYKSITLNYAIDILLVQKDIAQLIYQKLNETNCVINERLINFSDYQLNTMIS